MESASADGTRSRVRNVQCLMPGSFTQTDPQLRSILHELLPLEPIFHTKEFGFTRADVEKRMAADYWEVGASGRRYSREFILDFLAKNPPVDAASAGWQSSDHALRELGPDTYLFTYCFNASVSPVAPRFGGRRTRAGGSSTIRARSQVLISAPSRCRKL